MVKLQVWRPPVAEVGHGVAARLPDLFGHRPVQKGGTTLAFEPAQGMISSRSKSPGVHASCRHHDPCTSLSQTGHQLYRVIGIADNQNILVLDMVRNSIGSNPFARGDRDRGNPVRQCRSIGYQAGLGSVSHPVGIDNQVPIELVN